MGGIPNGNKEQLIFFIIKLLFLIIVLRYPFIPLSGGVE